MKVNAPKKAEAPFKSSYFITNLQLTSLVMLAMEEKACITSAQKCIAKKIPVRIWITKSHPNNESKFLE